MLKFVCLDKSLISLFITSSSRLSNLLKIGEISSDSLATLTLLFKVIFFLKNKLKNIFFIKFKNQEILKFILIRNIVMITIHNK